MISDFHLLKKGKYGVNGICKACKNAYTLEWKNKKRLKNIPKILEYLGGEYKCSRCSFKHHTHYPFDWHHIVPSTKDASPMDLVFSEWEVLKRELDKCIFLCSNCHRIEHNE